MFLYFVRHGNPDYSIDSLTEKGKEEARLTGEFLSQIPFDRIYSSPLGRAKLTASYTADILKKELEIRDYFSEDYAGKNIGATYKNKWTWVFWSPKYDKVLLNNFYNTKWFDDPAFKGTTIKKFFKDLNNYLDSFFLELNLKRNKKSNVFTPIGPVPENVVIFSHGGIGMEIIPLILGINYPLWCKTHKEISTCGIVKIFIDGEKKSRPLLHSFNELKY